MCEFRVKYCYSNKSWSVVFLLGEGEAEDCFLFSSIQLFLQCFISHSDCTSRAVYTLLAKSITSASEIFLLTDISYVK